ncbi:MAG: ABC transporter ATP-binding protein [Candidatus Zixiibacteriota bacterium]|nr:MAG: ABC transporter ATP-binding protein [candidate division Zixibacteria bacterium]
MTERPAVTIDNLSRHFDSFKAVDGISLEVTSGETFGFLGANGAGKTTTIRMLCGLLAPTSGSGTVAGFDIYRQAEEIKKSIGYMSQKFSLYPDLTGKENLSFYGAAYGMNGSSIASRTEELAERLDLHDFIDRPTRSLPVGWRQRLALGVSLLHRPRILFLDEPTSGVDPVFRRKFWKILYELAEEGVTVFVTTHYMDEAEYCGRISIMHQGKIVEVGQPFELIQKHRAENLEELFINLINGREAANAEA